MIGAAGCTRVAGTVGRTLRVDGNRDLSEQK